MNCKNLEYRSN